MRDGIKVSHGGVAKAAIVLRLQGNPVSGSLQAFVILMKHICSGIVNDVTNLEVSSPKFRV